MGIESNESRKHEAGTKLTRAPGGARGEIVQDEK